MLVSGSVDTKVKVWDLRTKNSIHTLKNHTKPVSAVKISAGTEHDMFIASSSSDSYIKICTLRTGRNIASLRHDSSSIHTLAINSITKTLASGQ